MPQTLRIRLLVNEPMTYNLRRLVVPSRRQLLLQTLALAACHSATRGSEPRFNVRRYGAEGDGIADDLPAIQSACNAAVIAGSGELYFPPGTYRTGRTATPNTPFGLMGAITISGVENLRITFEQATLLIDNLNQAGVGDQYHGIVVIGPAKRIVLDRPHVVWRNRPTKRSRGDGIRVIGSPDGWSGIISRPVDEVTIIDSVVENAPQAGLILMGCSNVTVTKHISNNTLADGFHLNACRRVLAQEIRGINCGDDACALVTYEGKEISFLGAPWESPFALPELGQWNNAECTINSVYASGGVASGLRLAGANHVRVGNVLVREKPFGVIAECGKIGPRNRWQTVANSDVHIKNIDAFRCGAAFYVDAYNVTEADSSRYWRQDLEVDMLRAVECATAAHIRNVAGVRIQSSTVAGGKVVFNPIEDCFVPKDLAKLVKNNGGMPNTR